MISMGKIVVHKNYCLYEKCFANNINICINFLNVSTKSAVIRATNPPRATKADVSITSNNCKYFDAAR